MIDSHKTLTAYNSLSERRNISRVVKFEIAFKIFKPHIMYVLNLITVRLKWNLGPLFRPCFVAGTYTAFY